MHVRLVHFAILFPLFFASATASAQAVTPPLVQESQPADPRRNQKVEMLHAEDESVVIDEVRYGGQVQSTRVQPKSGMPAYEMQPTDLARSRADPRETGAPTSRRVWNVLDF